MASWNLFYICVRRCGLKEDGHVSYGLADVVCNQCLPVDAGQLLAGMFGLDIRDSFNFGRLLKGDDLVV